VTSSPSDDPHLRRLLIVDDDPDVLASLPVVLAHPRIEIDTAANGIAGLAAARRSSPHLVLLDAYLPGMDGFEVFRQLRRDPALRYARVILISGTAETGALALAKELGAYGWIRKPLAPVAFRRKVFAALELEVPDESGATPAPEPGEQTDVASRRGAVIGRAEPKSSLAPPPGAPRPVLALGPARRSPPEGSPVPSDGGVAHAAFVLFGRLERASPHQARLGAARVEVLPTDSLALVVKLAVGGGVRAIFVVEPLAGLTVRAFAEYLATQGIRAPLVQITDGMPAHPAIARLPEAFTPDDVARVIAALPAAPPSSAAAAR
jgi:CheY-like chemotaxis protein